MIKTIKNKPLRKIFYMDLNLEIVNNKRFILVLHTL